MTEAALPRKRGRNRQFDIVLFGATGFTGRLVAEYLARHYSDTDLRWAIAGRNASKLEGVIEALKGIDQRAARCGVLVADSGDYSALGELARRTEVVCTTVGPYARYGSELVRACVEHGTDYCDLTGEVQWIRRMIDAHHEEAKRTGARIVHCCGFDSIPSDLGTFMLEEHARVRHGSPCSEVKAFFTEMRGGFSGGTVLSMLNVLEEVSRDPSLRRVLGNPYALNPEGERSGPDRRDQQVVRHDPDLPGYTGPFIMAAINTRIVRRSNALLAYSYGRDFRYAESMGFGRGARGLSKAVTTTAGLGAFGVGLLLGPTRKALARFVLPKSGEGPGEAARRRGRFTVRLVGKGDAAGARFVVHGVVRGTSDPGYGETSKMLAESALCLSLDGARLSSGGGVLTPASCMGSLLIERLRAAGMTFEVGD